MLLVTALYASLLGLYFVWLSARVTRARRIHKVPLGTPHRLVERAARAQGNFAEYVPLALILLALGEINGVPDWALHVFGTLLVAGRVIHATGISSEPEDFRLRVFGIALTFTVILFASAALLGFTLRAL
ncbi:MAPEG family protein [Falsiroseomonas sp. HW251]|uniref:MAPEG family protein n=1 Tax=Falsiroseomonas sp. HW251 TaxID=3390998 RepID=UPI003D313F19